MGPEQTSNGRPHWGRGTSTRGISFYTASAKDNAKPKTTVQNTDGTDSPIQNCGADGHADMVGCETISETTRVDRNNHAVGCASGVMGGNTGSDAGEEIIDCSQPTTSQESLKPLPFRLTPGPGPLTFSASSSSIAAAAVVPRERAKREKQITLPSNSCESQTLSGNSSSNIEAANKEGSDFDSLNTGPNVEAISTHNQADNDSQGKTATRVKGPGLLSNSPVPSKLASTDSYDLNMKRKSGKKSRRQRGSKNKTKNKTPVAATTVQVPQGVWMSEIEPVQVLGGDAISVSDSRDTLVGVPHPVSPPEDNETDFIIGESPTTIPSSSSSISSTSSSTTSSTSSDSISSDSISTNSLQRVPDVSSSTLNNKIASMGSDIDTAHVHAVGAADADALASAATSCQGMSDAKVGRLFSVESPAVSGGVKKDVNTEDGDCAGQGLVYSDTYGSASPRIGNGQHHGPACGGDPQHCYGQRNEEKKPHSQPNFICATGSQESDHLCLGEGDNKSPNPAVDLKSGDPLNDSTSDKNSISSGPTNTTPKLSADVPTTAKPSFNSNLSNFKPSLSSQGYCSKPAQNQPGLGKQSSTKESSGPHVNDEGTLSLEPVKISGNIDDVTRVSTTSSDSSCCNVNSEQKKAAGTTSDYLSHPSTTSSTGTPTSATYTPGGALSPGSKSLAFLHKTPRGGFVKHEVMCTFPKYLDDDSVRTRVLEKCHEANQRLRKRNEVDDGSCSNSDLTQVCGGDSLRLSTDDVNENAYNNGNDSEPTSPTDTRATLSPMLRKKSGELVKSSLKLARTQSMPSTKAVRFDTNLEQVRRFSYREKPTAVRRSSSPVRFEWGSSDSDTNSEGDGESSYEHSSGCDDDDASDNDYEDTGYDDYVSFFRRPWASSSSSRHNDLASNLAPKGRHLSLCNCEFPSSSTKPDAPVFVENLGINSKGNLTGNVSVRNLSYAKHVIAIYTQNNWQSVEEVEALYSSDQANCSDGYDRFTFEINLDHAKFEAPTRNRSSERARARLTGQAQSGSSTSISSLVSNSSTSPSYSFASSTTEEAKFSLCVRYRSANGEFWDNNNESNYNISVRVDKVEADKWERHQNVIEMRAARSNGGSGSGGRGGHGDSINYTSSHRGHSRSKGSAHHRRNRTYPGSSLDDLHDDLMVQPVKTKNKSNGGGLASRYNFASSYKTGPQGVRSPPKTSNDSDSDETHLPNNNRNNTNAPLHQEHHHITQQQLNYITVPPGRPDSSYSYNFNTKPDMDSTSMSAQKFYSKQENNYPARGRNPVSAASADGKAKYGNVIDLEQPQPSKHFQSHQVESLRNMTDSMPYGGSASGSGGSGDSSGSSSGSSGTSSPTSNLAHIPYHDIINKYCFFKSNSMATTPPSSTSPGLVPQGRTPSPQACSPSSAAVNVVTASTANSQGSDAPVNTWRQVQV